MSVEEMFKDIEKSKIPWYEKISWFFHRWFERLISNPIREVKWFLQKVFRKNHTSDIELWGLYEYLSKYILRKLKAFKNYDRVGYPSTFASYYKDEWRSKEEYDKAVEKGDMKGGGSEAWEKCLDEMIFAFEFIIYYEHHNDKKRLAFCEKYGLEDPYENYKFIEEYYNRVQNGLDLFAKYFWSLWD